MNRPYSPSEQAIVDWHAGHLRLSHAITRLIELGYTLHQAKCLLGVAEWAARS